MPTCKIISVPIFTFKCFPKLLTPHTLLSHTHQPHFSSSPRTNLNSTLSSMPSSDRLAKSRPAQIVPPLPRPLHPDHTAPPRSHPSIGSFASRLHPIIGEIAPTQPHHHAPPLHVSDPPPPSPKLPSSMSSNSHPSYPSTHITQSPFWQTHTHLARSTPTRSSCRRPSLIPISLFPDLSLTEYIMYIL